MKNPEDLDLDTLQAVMRMIDGIPYTKNANHAYQLAIIDVQNGIRAMMNKARVPFDEREKGENGDG